jgi:hypothetical protein
LFQVVLLLGEIITCACFFYWFKLEILTL